MLSRHIFYAWVGRIVLLAYSVMVSAFLVMMIAVITYAAVTQPVWGWPSENLQRLAQAMLWTFVPALLTLFPLVLIIAWRCYVLLRRDPSVPPGQARLQRVNQLITIPWYGLIYFARVVPVEKPTALDRALLALDRGMCRRGKLVISVLAGITVIWLLALGWALQRELKGSTYVAIKPGSVKSWLLIHRPVIKAFPKVSAVEGSTYYSYIPGPQGEMGAEQRISYASKASGEQISEEVVRYLEQRGFVRKSRRRLTNGKGFEYVYVKDSEKIGVTAEPVLERPLQTRVSAVLQRVSAVLHRKPPPL